jgi:hypothetical protein
VSYNPYGPPDTSPQTAAWPTEVPAASVPGWDSGQGYGGPGMPPAGPQKSNTGLVVILVLLAVAALGAGAYFVTSGGDDDDNPDTETAGSTTPTGNTPAGNPATDDGNPGPVTTLPGDLDDIELPDTPNAPDVPIEVAAADAGPPEDPPTGDAQFDDLAGQCFEGDMQACDDLYLQTPVGSEYEAYGDTCGARVSDSHGYYCTDLLPDPAPPAG